LTGESSITVVEVKDLSFSINGIRILSNINLKIKKGEFVGLIGPNGAGKTTLLKSINGILKPDAGCVELNGRNINTMSCKRIAKEAALMHQNIAVSFPLSALEVVLTGRYPHLKRTAGESREDYEIARRCMRYTGTEEFENCPVTHMSGGERQRVLFAKVLAQETELILLDEPTASLDIAHQEQIFRYSAELSRSGRTIAAAVHDLKIASKYCSRLVLMKEGRIIADGAPQAVLTSENLSEAYGVNAFVYKNRITGQLDFFIHGTEPGKARKRVHVIGGGGSASGVIRKLFESGFDITAGVFAHGDSDLLSAEIFGIECVKCKPFCEIDDNSMKANLEKIEKADITILCNMPFGKQNLRNLEAAMHADTLIIIEDDDPESRDFTGGKAAELYSRLKNKAVVTTFARLHEVL
jgi:iron complex transport system ATP-binding protein